MTSQAAHGSPVTQDDEARDTVWKLLDKARFCMMTTVDDNGRLVSRPMGIQQTDDDLLWFFAAADSPKVAELRADPRINLAFSDSDDFISLSGTAEVVHDPAKNRELWNKFAEAWLQAEPEDERVVLIKVTADTAEYWDTPAKPSRLVGIVRTLTTGEKPPGGDNRTVDL
ncbi:pyridoxamine 5'-phosphate oxidase family protein [Allobranchiibius sp. GilTou38]|uniref:pyridoxamine 5'-phosphate oxidase family protein n=1 Tax=Allobranchiibius sp. GilTou38 TaxID=2815210 RepID=UPI001AA17EDF|nr:pyridoxamine 5'-phosphate oxidase family protein [Allobranchiibius sp. GilTou38]MBO1768310.1 pyridoxamine 5'-phosphate oxidase family protein [Allobranchiibius sp. GilTou38]